MGQSVGTTVCAADGSSSFVCGEGLAVKDEVEPCEGYCGAGACILPPSCVGVSTTCGVTESGACCASSLVLGGEFDRGEDNAAPATVSDFRLDKYEVTVGRFRKFVAAMVGGWLPPAGSGKHSHLRDGLGVVGTTGEDEPGWDSAWTVGGTDYRLYSGPDTEDEWDTSLVCDDFATWTPAADLNETRPINCLNWYQAAAFCIWDGGFLPTEAEWEYAAAGGAVERLYPWGTAEPTIDRASYLCMVDGSEQDDCSFEDIRKVGSLPDGDGLYGQSDLGGNMWEWALDWYVAPFAPGACEDCGNVTVATERSLRSGSWESYPYSTASAYRTHWAPTTRDQNFGVRCARPP